MCPNCRAFITTADKVCPYCDAEVGARAIDRRATGEVAGIPHARFTTMMILLINTGLYAACVLYASKAARGGPSLDLDGQTLVMFGAKFGLENTFKLAALAGNPQEKLRFIHVAGTNGKGSTCAFAFLSDGAHEFRHVGNEWQLN